MSDEPKNPPKPKQKRQRRFARELSDLQSRVDMALVLLRRAESIMGDGADGRRNELLGVAVEVLMGDKE